MSGVDYGAPDVWSQLARRIGVDVVPRTTSNCARVECEPGWSWNPQLVDHDAWLVLAGRGAAVVGGTTAELRPGSLMLLRPGDSGRFTQQPDDRLTVAFCHFGFVEPVTGAPTAVDARWLPSRHVIFDNVALVGDPLQRAIRLARDQHPLRQLEASAMLTCALVEAYVQDARACGQAADLIDPRVQDVVDFVRDHPQRRPTLTEAARRAALSPARLSRLFSEQMGTSFRDFVLSTRLEHARYLLTETSMTVAAISDALGYTDVFLFSRQFRRRYGEPPSHLRRRP
jgi:AraC-like DNA-binding protein